MILAFLTFLFTINTVLNGVTNSQVQLSANLISDSFVSLEYQQVLLSKQIDQIERYVTLYNYDTSRDKTEVEQGISNAVEQATNSMNEITGICKDFSQKSMNNKLENAYGIYMASMQTYLEQATLIANGITSNDTATIKENIKTFEGLKADLQTSESDFQKVLDSSIKHEVTLVHSRVSRSTVIIWVMAIIFLIAATISFILTMKIIIKPLKQANKNLGEIIRRLEVNEGDLTVRLDNKSDDEIGQIIEGINRFLDTLQQAMISIKSGSHLIQNTTVNISTHIFESKDETSNVSAALNELSASMEEISSTIQNIESGAQHVHTAANTIAENAKVNQVYMKDVVKRAEKICEEANNSKTQTTQIVDGIKSTIAASIQKSRSVEKINELTENILGISSQTNLLALNASIEAARAGEAGKGFAIVADEIRILAESTKSTANDIQHISVVVTESVEELVNNVNRIMVYITEKVLNDYDGFVEVAKNNKLDADSINDMLGHFSNSSEELRSVSTSIACGIQGIMLAVEESVNVVIDSNESTNNLLNSITTISMEATHCEEIVSDLNMQVSKFKKVE
jgi:methyl-accepting chemotaxis protein